MELRFKILTLEEIRDVYYSDMIHQFPDRERRSYGNIAAMVKKGMYAGYGLYDDTGLCAYALAALFPNRHTVLLDYLAAVRDRKGQGFGSEILSRLRSQFGKTDRILIETEDPDALEGAEKDIARRRLGFYARNGYRETGVQIFLFSVWYRLYEAYEQEEPDCELIGLMENVYRTIVPAALYEKNVYLQLRKEG